MERRTHDVLWAAILAIICVIAVGVAMSLAPIPLFVRCVIFFVLIMVGWTLCFLSRRKDTERAIEAYCKVRSHWWKFKLNASRRLIMAKLFDGKTPEEWEGIDKDFDTLATALSIDGFKVPKTLSDNAESKNAKTRLSQDCS